MVRATSLANIEGGICQLTTKLLLQFFQASGHDLQVSGINLQLAGDSEPVALYGRLGVLVSDEPALKEMLSCKGHAGNKPCVLCLNCYSSRAEGHDDVAVSDYPVPIHETEFKQFVKHSDMSIQVAVARLHGYKDTMPITTFKEFEKIYGWTYNVWNPVLDARVQLGVASCVMWDWSHCYVCDGVADVEFGLFMWTCHSQKSYVTYAELAHYVREWAPPKDYPKLERILDPTSARNNLRKRLFTCSASEFLTNAPILRETL